MLHRPRHLVTALVATGVLGLIAGIDCDAFAQTGATTSITSNINRLEKKHKKINNSEIDVGEVSKKAKAIALKKAPYSVFTISHKEIKDASPFTNAQSILNRSPSINVVSPGPNGVRTSIEFRGFQNGSFAETFGGISLNDPLSGDVTNGGGEGIGRNAIPITLNDIRSVTTHNGIGNPSTNSYNSLGGTIAFEPRQPKRHFGVSVNAGYGSFNTFNWGASVNTGTIFGTRTLLSYARNTSHGWYRGSEDQNSNFYLANVIPINGGRTKFHTYVIVNRNEGYTPRSIPLPLLQQFGYNYGYPTSLVHSYDTNTDLTAILGVKSLIGSHAMLGGKVYARINQSNRSSYANPQALSNPTFGKYLQVYFPNKYSTYSSYKLGYNPQQSFGSVAAGTAYENYFYRTSTLGFTPYLKLSLPYNRVTIGGDVNYNVAHDGLYEYGAANMPEVSGYNDRFDERYFRLMSSAYIQDDIHFWHDRVNITPGLKYLYQFTSTTSLASSYGPTGALSQGDAFTSPTVGINIEPIKNLNAYVSWGRNIQFPTPGIYYNALNYPTNIVTQIQPEYVTDYEAGIRYAAPHIGFHSSLDAYREDFKNKFQTYHVPGGPYIEENIGTATYQGIELALHQDMGHIVMGRWSLYGNYSYNVANYGAQDSGSNKLIGVQITKVPKNQFNLGLNWRYRHFRLNLHGKYVSAQQLYYSYANGTSEAAAPAYFVMDLGLFDTIPVHTMQIKSMKLGLQINNLLNRHYFADAYYNQPYPPSTQFPPFLSILQGVPRAIFGNVTVRFS